MIERPTRTATDATSNRASLVVFRPGVVVPGFVAFARWFDIALENPTFGDEPRQNPVQFGRDATLQSTAVGIYVPNCDG